MSEEQAGKDQMAAAFNSVKEIAEKIKIDSFSPWSPPYRKVEARESDSLAETFEDIAPFVQSETTDMIESFMRLGPIVTKLDEVLPTSERSLEEKYELTAEDRQRFILDKITKLVNELASTVAELKEELQGAQVDLSKPVE